MQKFFSIALIVIAVANVVYSFISPSENYNILTIEVDVWIYRFIWAFLGVFLTFGYIKKYGKGSEAEDGQEKK